MSVRTTIETYIETLTISGETYHNVDDVGRTTYTKNDATKTAAQLCKLGYATYIKMVTGLTERYCIYTSPQLGGV